MPLPSTNLSQFSRPFSHPRRNVGACFAQLDNDVSSSVVVPINGPVSLLSESSAEDEPDPDFLESVSRVSGSLARLLGGGLKNVLMSIAGIAPPSLSALSRSKTTWNKKAWSTMCMRAAYIAH